MTERALVVSHEAADPRFLRLIDPDEPALLLATGYAWVEGPVWNPVGRYLLFSDIPGDTCHRWDESGVHAVRHPTGFGNGMTYDSDLDLLVCVHASSSVTKYAADGEVSNLATHFEGAELNSPNDLVVRSDGSVYFTDPTYGRMPAFGVGRELSMGFQGVYRVPPGGGDVQLLVDRQAFTEPNGLCFSPDERMLYVNDTEQASIRVYRVRDDGSLGDERLFASGIRSDVDPGLPDGMKCDEEGNVWVTAPGGIWVFAPDGTRLGTVRTPERAANLAWGGDGWRTLFVTASSSIYAIRTLVGPNREPFMKRDGR